MPHKCVSSVSSATLAAQAGQTRRGSRGHRESRHARAAPLAKETTTMPPTILGDALTTLATLTASATLVVGLLAILFNVIFLSKRAVRRQTVRTRLRAGITASVLLIGLA